MVTCTASSKGGKRPGKAGAAGRARSATPKRITVASVVMEEARRTGLLDGDSTEHVSFRAPKALIDAAKHESGATKPTELGLLALAMLAQPDPAASYMQRTRGKLGADHELDY
ncbi:hypothetical protein Sj15T_10270 [Sphingobium sp. TA15]|uniref:Uncharacterized protein n=1 Tax=Sphingobium indicum (strain DSM 16413 / CCM 7287 / MTCC 6362 / UT26 / NBRC 101211 / UT26S) TaxID=452662 RepID=D4Z8U7_SPHIU|nr:hypothetical protein [Sphingobium indicum]BAI99029.1 hypothetical protein SJA_P1-00770 [Sphingobium indicum UT26S]BDD66006.1 hypothetical protein Sj15T_10270 [Sphingobium sp. TA15]